MTKRVHDFRNSTRRHYFHHYAVRDGKFTSGLFEKSYHSPITSIGDYVIGDSGRIFVLTDFMYSSIHFWYEFEAEILNLEVVGDDPVSVEDIEKALK